MNTKQLREIIISEVEKELNGRKEVAIALSSGMDSITILFALLELGIKPTAYTFRIGDKDTTDSRIARKNCEIFGLNHVDVNVQFDKDQFKSLFTTYGCIKKTYVEVMYLMLSVFKAVKEPVLFVGYPDYHFALSTEAVHKYQVKQSLEKIQAFREEKQSEAGRSQMKIWQAMCDDLDIDIKFPLGAQSLYEWFKPYSWNELNKPPKHVFVSAFSDYYSKAEKRSPMPLNSFDDVKNFYTENILQSSEYNPLSKTNIAAIYKELYNKFNQKTTLSKFVKEV